jgi:hypothetical protein
LVKSNFWFFVSAMIGSLLLEVDLASVEHSKLAKA